MARSILHKLTHIGVLLGASLVVGASLSGASWAEIKLVDQPQVTERYVRLGDLFTDTGKAAEEIIFEAPEPGGTKKLSIYEIDRLATEFGLDFERPRYISSVRIHRKGTEVTTEDLRFLIEQGLVEHGIEDNVRLRIFGTAISYYIAADQSLMDIDITRLDVSDRRDRFSAELNLPSEAGEPRRIRISGRIEEVRLAPVFKRAIAPGEQIDATDIEWKDIPAQRLTSRTISSELQLIGQTVRRTMRPGQLININDVQAPVSIRKGSAVVMNYIAGPLKISYVVRARENGAIGDYILVENPKSNNRVDARVVSADLVEVVVPTAARYASR